MSNSNEPRRDCAHYQWGDGDYPRELGARCRLYGEFFSLGTRRVLRPQCAGCAGFKPREERGGQGGSVMMLQSRLAEAEQRAQRAEAEAMRLREALSALYAAQNGPPLIRDAAQWEEAMDKAQRALGEDA